MSDNVNTKLKFVPSYPKLDGNKFTFAQMDSCDTLEEAIQKLRAMGLPVDNRGLISLVDHETVPEN